MPATYDEILKRFDDAPPVATVDAPPEQAAPPPVDYDAILSRFNAPTNQSLPAEGTPQTQGTTPTASPTQRPPQPGATSAMDYDAILSRFDSAPPPEQPQPGPLTAAMLSKLGWKPANGAGRGDVQAAGQTGAGQATDALQGQPRPAMGANQAWAQEQAAASIQAERPFAGEPGFSPGATERAKAFATEAVEQTAPAAVGLAVGAKVGAVTAPFIGPWAIIPALVAGAGASMATAYGQKKLQQVVTPKVAMEQYETARRVWRKQDPLITAAGQILPDLVMFSPKSLPKLANEIRVFTRTVRAGKAAFADPKAVAAAVGVADSVLSAGVAGGFEAYNQMAEGDFNGARLALVMAAGAILTEARYGTNPQRQSMADSLLNAAKQMPAEKVAVTQEQKAAIAAKRESYVRKHAATISSQASDARTRTAEQIAGLQETELAPELPPPVQAPVQPPAAQPLKSLAHLPSDLAPAERPAPVAETRAEPVPVAVEPPTPVEAKATTVETASTLLEEMDKARARNDPVAEHTMKQALANMPASVVDEALALRHPATPTPAPVPESTYGAYRKVNGQWITKGGKPVSAKTAEGIERRAAKAASKQAPVEAPKADAEPWQMTREEFDREFWLHGRGATHPRFGQDTTIGGITKSPDEARAFARVQTGGPPSVGEIALIRGTSIDPETVTRIGNKRTYSPVLSTEWKVNGSVPGDVKDPHRYLVEKALRDGKDVPARVLSQYPDIPPKAATAETPQSMERPLADALTPEQKAATEAAWEEKTRGMAGESGKAENIGAEAEAAKKTGAVRIGYGQGVMAEVARRVRKMVSTTQNLGAKTWGNFKQWRAVNSSIRFDMELATNAVNDVADLAPKGPARDAMRNTILDYIEGRADDAAMRAAITATGAPQAQAFPVANRLRALKRKIEANGPRLANMLAEVFGETHPLVAAIRENPAYAHIMYRKHWLGEGYEAKQQDVDDAVDFIRGEIGNEILKFQTDAQTLNAQWNGVARWLETGDATMLAPLPPDMRSAAAALGKTYFGLRDLAQVQTTPAGNMSIVRLASNIEDNARSIVDAMLKPDTGPVNASGGLFDTGALMARHLNNPVIKRLLGQVRDPAVIAASTIEAQERIMAQQVLLRSIMDGTRGTHWSTARSVEKGLTVQMPTDKRRYGPLASTEGTPVFVSKDLAEALRLNSEKANSLMGKLGEGVVDLAQLQRTVALMTPKAIMRNFETSIYHFALGSGDAFLPTWKNHLGRAVGLIHRAAKGDAAALRELRDLAANDVFRTDSNSMLDELKGKLTSGGKIGGFLDGFHKAYAYVDFFSKYASYNARVDHNMKTRGMSPAQARTEAGNHVRKFYQYREDLPGIAHSLSRNPVMFDYASYKINAAMILGRQVAHIGEAAKARDYGEFARAFIGFAAGRSYWAATRSPKIAAALGVGTLAMRAMLGDKKDEKEVSPEEALALRQLAQPYDANEALLFTRQQNADGTRTYRQYVVGGGAVSAFPIEDWMLGMAQLYSEGGTPRVGTFPEFIKDNALGMFGEALVEGAGFARDVLKGDVPTSQRFVDQLARLGRDNAVGPIGQAVKYVQARGNETRRERLKAEGNTEALKLAPTGTADEQLARMFDFARVYRMEQPDLNRALVFRVRKQSKIIEDTQAMMRGERRAEGTLTVEQRALQEKRARAIMALAPIIRQMKALDPEYFTEAHLSELLRMGGLGNKDARAAVLGTKADESVDPYVPREDAPTSDTPERRPARPSRQR